MAHRVMVFALQLCQSTGVSVLMIDTDTLRQASTMDEPPYFTSAESQMVNQLTGRVAQLFGQFANSKELARAILKVIDGAKAQSKSSREGGTDVSTG